MRLRKLTVRHFRNIGLAAIDLEGSRHFFVGANGQGKTNLLEAVGFITALRSFRTVDHRFLVGTGQQTAAIACNVEHERRGETHIMIKIHRERKELWCDHARVARLADHLGQFPTVIFSSQDLQLVRGSPSSRRRWLDLTLSAVDPAYFQSLQNYGRALEARNTLLKRSDASPAEFEAFERQIAPAAAAIINSRRSGLETLGTALGAAYAAISGSSETAGLEYLPNFAEASGEVIAARLEAGRARDSQVGSTQVGPHRDDFRFKVRGSPADDFGSEGQQRSAVLALRLAEAGWYLEKTSIRPVLLADDVLGELDPERRERFWVTLDQKSQVFATGTAPPDASLGDWQLVSVADGDFTDRRSGTANGRE